MRRLIINADDFGMTRGVNRAIAEGHAAGIVTSATLMANESAIDDAIAIATHNCSLGIGCHIVLVDGAPISEPASVQSLIAWGNHRGALFRPGIAHLAVASIAGKVRTHEVRQEAAAQIQRLKSRGLMLSHVDCHMHSHILPPVLRAVLQGAREHGIRAIRNPFEPGWSVAATHKRSSMRSWSRSVQVSLLRALKPQFLRMVKESDLMTTDGTIGIAVTGLLDREMLTLLMENMPNGTWELVTHPGYYDGDLSNASTELKQSRAIEHELLTSPETLDLFRRSRIELISYREL